MQPNLNPQILCLINPRNFFSNLKLNPVLKSTSIGVKSLKCPVSNYQQPKNQIINLAPSPQFPMIEAPIITLQTELRYQKLKHAESSTNQEGENAMKSKP